MRSKWLEKHKERNKKEVKKRIEKLEKEIKQYRREFADRPWDCYQKAIDRREAEIEELERFGTAADALREVEDYRETVESLRSLLGKIGILAANIDPSDQKSNANLIRLTAMTSQYNSKDEEFRQRAERGVW